MAGNDIKDLTRMTFEEVWNKGNLDLLDEVMSPDSVFHVPGWGEVRGPDGFREFASTTRNAFPDIKVTIEDQVVEGDIVATRWSWRGTHKGEFLGVAPTGRRVLVNGITMGRASADGRGESWLIGDLVGLLDQIGALPEKLSRELTGVNR